MKDFLQWWNAIYWIPLCLSLLWILLAAVTGHGGGDGDGGAEGGDAGGDVDATHGGVEASGAEAGHDAAGGEATQAHNGSDGGDSHHDDMAAKLLAVLGLGRIPITLLIGLYMLFWGTIGLLVNSLCRDAGVPPAVFILPSLAGTFVATTVITRLSAGVIGKFMPSTETFAIVARDLIGRDGHVVYLVTENTGTVDVTDAYGTVHRRMAKTEPGAPQLPSGTKVLVVGFDDEDNRLVVKEYS